tara:strand:- start:58 stop:321 length:264 start_codon:yes stop_codon:yes gene_type:complete
MNKLQELINKTKCSVSIDVNKHRDFYETIEEYIEPDDIADISADVWAKMIELDTCVRLQFYPDTPIGFYTIHHYDVEIAINIALNEV